MAAPGGTVKLLIDAYTRDRCSGIVAALQGRLERKVGEVINRFVYTGEWTIPTPMKVVPEPEATAPGIPTPNL